MRVHTNSDDYYPWLVTYRAKTTMVAIPKAATPDMVLWAVKEAPHLGHVKGNMYFADRECTEGEWYSVNREHMFTLKRG